MPGESNWWHGARLKDFWPRGGNLNQKLIVGGIWKEEWGIVIS